MINANKLRTVVEKLEVVHEKIAADLTKEFPEHDPYVIKDSTGRYILLESLTAIANARAALLPFLL